MKLYQYFLVCSIVMLFSFENMQSTAIVFGETSHDISTGISVVMRYLDLNLETYKTLKKGVKDDHIDVRVRFRYINHISYENIYLDAYRMQLGDSIYKISDDFQDFLVNITNSASDKIPPTN